MFNSRSSCNNNNRSSSSSMFPLYPVPSTTVLLNNNNTANTTKRKRRPAGTPDPEAEVVSLSPRTLLESDRYVCEICNQGFQRDQNLQMHRRRHKVPWKLLKRDHGNRAPTGGVATRKRVFVCPETTCLHHDPCHALGDLVGIKKHFRRKHSTHKQWACHKCSKAYAVHSDFKAHLKTCGTRGHSCDCGRVFSRVESFIEHQDTCHMGRLVTNHRRQYNHDAGRHDDQQQQPPRPPEPASSLSRSNHANTANMNDHCHNLELQLSIGSSDLSQKQNDSSVEGAGVGGGVGEELEGGRVVNAVVDVEDYEMAVKVAMAEKARMEAKREVEVAEREFASAKKMRQQAQAELERAQEMMEVAVKRIRCNIMQITCHACKQQEELQTHQMIS